MRVRIHRGAHEIGGSCVEVEASTGERLVLDLGRPLSAGWGDEVALPDVSGLRDRDESLLGVLISHPHLDHYGLLGEVDAGVPIFIGQGAQSVIEAARFFSPKTPRFRVSGHLMHREAFAVGPFHIEPRLNDHSGFDAYSVSVTVDGRRLFYTGDLRGHGRKRRMFDELLADPPRDIDVLLMEGTHIRTDPPMPDPATALVCASEEEVENRLTAACSEADGLVAVAGSAQNVDRLVSVHRAALRSERATVLDLYASTVAAAAAPTIPQTGHRGLRIYVPNRQRVLVKSSREFERTHGIRDVRVFPEEIAASPGKFLMHVPSSAFPELLQAGCLAPSGLAVWSLWDGYLNDRSGAAWLQSMQVAGVPVRSIHTSGHAGIADLQRLVDALQPGRIVPIHSEAPARYVTLFPRVDLRSDGEWWDV